MTEVGVLEDSFDEQMQLKKKFCAQIMLLSDGVVLFSKTSAYHFNSIICILPK